VRLGFAHPVGGRAMEFASGYPADLAGALAVLRAES
jgi:23S rRNA pseudouridine1911/1915/1917 synthase